MKRSRLAWAATLVLAVPAIAASETMYLYDSSGNLFATLDSQNIVPTLQDSGWIYPALANGFYNNVGGTYGTTRYRKIGSVVYLEVAVTRSVGDGLPMFTLPVGYRPSQQLVIATASMNLGAGQIDPDGTVRSRYQTANPLVFSTSFPADQ
jgi:hypothetical protein